VEFTPSLTCQIPDVKRLVTNPLTLEPERSSIAREESAVREETRQKITAKELAGQRQLERKMLAIFDDQVK